MEAFTQPLISVASLAAAGPEQRFIVIDCRFDLAHPDQGRADYLEAHIPGAQYAHLDEDLSAVAGAGGGGRHPLPDGATLVERFSAFGIDPAARVVVYDHGGGAIAGRLWWMLRYMGHDAVAVLDGGFGAWRAAGQPLESGQVIPERGRFHGVPNSTMLVDAAAVPGARLLVDSRDGARYRGEHEPLDPVAGHIPGARHRFFATNLASGGMFRDSASLRSEFEQLLADCPASEAVFYCGSGVTACHNLLAMAHAGMPMARLYAGSWSEWCGDPSRPVERQDGSGAD